MQVSNFTILKNQELAPQLFDLQLEGDASDLTEPGQFVQVAIPGFYLRRPLSVADFSPHSLRLIYKTVGPGTQALAQLRTGQLSLITGLGHGYRLPEDPTTRPLLVGGGTGLPPLLALAKALTARSFHPILFMGLNRAEDLFLQEDLEAAGCQVHITTMDGSLGFPGNAVQALRHWYAEAQPGYGLDSVPAQPGHGPAPVQVYACGPLPMLKALNDFMEAEDLDGQVSMEERMGCGFGACMGCTLATKTGPQRVCQEGPVFDRKELLWN